LSSSSKPVIVVTRGDPAGIGPEITEKVIKLRSFKRSAEFVVIGRVPKSVKPGQASREAGHISVENIKEAVSLLESIKGPKALVTAPINKSTLHKAGYDYTGHTEMLAEFTGGRDVTMMFSASHVRLALVTRHIPLKEVYRKISVEKIVKTALHLDDALRNKFGIKDPVIGVAGLNPHAGDAGTIGDEEAKIIAPAIKKLRLKAKNVVGPYPPDILMRDLYSGKMDAAVSMYHDQGLPAFKMLYFDSGVNITLGLPFIRTSPDHGTAYAIAGKGKADTRSMSEAVALAIRLAR